MKKILSVFALLTICSVALAANEECWKKGYQKGYCDAKGQTYCVPPIPPIPPIAPIGRDDCESRFADGYVAGLAAGRN